MAQPVISVRDLRTSFRVEGQWRPAVNGVSFDVAPNETVAIVGESGSGKSVTALSIMRLIPQANGRVEGAVFLHDRNLLTLPEAAMRKVRGDDISMIFQEPMTSLNPVLTIGFQVSEALRYHRNMPPAEADRVALDLLDQVRIPSARSRFNDFPHHFSGGMRQRVMIAMALCCEPKLIIADEPTTALDVTIQAQILELMKDLTRRLGVALIVITHNLGIVARYADRVNVMYAGRIIESGTAQDIYHDPQHPYTLALLRSVPRMDRPRQARLDPVQGQPPDLTRLDDGCAFRPRCGFAVNRCIHQIPPLGRVGAAGHLAACWETETVAGSLQRAS